jgi:hypothetical protein
MVEQKFRNELDKMRDSGEKTALSDVLPEDSYSREYVKTGICKHPLISELIFLVLGQGRVFYNIVF